MFPVPDRFPEYVPDLFPTGNRFQSRPVPPRNRVVPSHPVNQMASQLPAPVPSHGKQPGTFYRTVSPDFCPACGGRDGPIP